MSGDRELLDSDGDKHGVTLLVYDTEANFATPHPDTSAEQPAGLAHLAHENNGEGCVSFASPTGESLSARKAVLEEVANYLADVHSITLANEIRALKTVPGEPT